MRGADSNSYKEHFAIYLSLDGEIYDNNGKISEGVIELMPETVATNQFKEYAVDLSSYAGQQGHIAIRHFNCTDQFFLIVDDFGLYDANAPWTTVDNANADGTLIDGLEPNTEYEYQVVYRYKDNDYEMPVATLTTMTDNPAPADITVTNITMNSATLNWKGYSNNYNLRYRPAATVTLSVPQKVSDDGSGYQMLLDANHSTYGTVISETAPLTESGSASAETYGNFAYKIPENADGALDTKNIVDGTNIKSLTITIPAGTYDWCIANPTPNDRVWIPTDGRMDDFVFEAGKHYIFTVTSVNQKDQVNMTVDGVGIDSGSSDWTTTNNITSTSYNLSGLREDTPYQVQVQSVKGEEQTEWTNAFFITCKEIELADNADNSAIIAQYNGRTCNVKLVGRTLYCDGSWNTLCLPFNLSDENLDDSPLKRFTIMELSNVGSNTGFDLSTNTLALDFVEANGIVAGHAYIVKWGKDDDFNEDEGTTAENIVNPEFKNVIISNEDPANQSVSSNDGYVTFTGTYAPVEIGTKGDKTKLFFAADNTLFYPNASMTIGAFRAYFQLNGITAGDPTNPTVGINNFVLKFGDETNAIENLQSPIFNYKSEGWYTIDGRRLQGKPSRPDVYINNGMKVVIE